MYQKIGQRKKSDQTGFFSHKVNTGEQQVKFCADDQAFITQRMNGM